MLQDALAPDVLRPVDSQIGPVLSMSRIVRQEKRPVRTDGALVFASNDPVAATAPKPGARCLVPGA